VVLAALWWCVESARVGGGGGDVRGWRVGVGGGGVGRLSLLAGWWCAHSLL
jgi:hypothetical protein